MGVLPLARSLDGVRALDHPVAVAGDRVHTYGDFLRAAAAVSAQARAQGSGRWLLACEEAWAFTCGLFGLLHGGCTVVIPPNFLPATLDRLASGMTGTLAGLPGVLPGDPAPMGPVPDGIIEFWTSGSSGEAKCIPKFLTQMAAEMEVLEGAFGHLCQGGPILGTVPHHHIYGCLFRILWPLAAGRPLAVESWGDPARFHPLPQGGPAPALVSSPALLSRLPQLMDLDALAPIASVAFSSGGPLRAEDALAWRRWVPAGVAEIYGSTETGGIAWRIQTGAPDDALWTPFPDVAYSFEADGALRIASPRVGPEPVRMEDAGEAAPGGRFRLKGRLDRIVKLGEKRIALPELEASLEAHPWIDKAALVLLDGPRPALGAVVVLAGDGRTAALEDRRATIRTLQRHLAARFEGVAVPKRWRFLDALPYDERGKLQPRLLAETFASHGRGAEGRPVLPRVLEHRGGEEDVFVLAMDPGLLAFQGHFPGNPILPGVVQVDWAIRFGALAFGALGPFQAITHLKFMDLIRPDTTVELHLALDPGRDRLRFHFAGETGRKSSGVIVFGASV